MSGAGIRDGERIVAEFPKNSREVLRIVVGQFKGHDLIHVRSWVPGADGETLVPTKSGIALRVETVPQLIDALQRAVTDTGAAPGGAPAATIGANADGAA